MAVKRATTSAAADAADKDETGTASTSKTSAPKETGGDTGTDKDIATQAEGRSTSVTAPNEVKNDPGATGNKTIDGSRIDAHKEALEARGDGALSPYTDIPAAGEAGDNSGGAEGDNSDGDGLKVLPKPGSKAAKSSSSAKTAADDGDSDDDSEKAAGEADESKPNTPTNVLDGAALGTSFTHGSADFTSTGIPVVDDQYSVDKIGEGKQFYASWLHNPAQSDDHYSVQNSLEDLRSGKLSRRGIPQDYWQEDFAKRPPLARRNSKSRKGYDIIG